MAIFHQSVSIMINSYHMTAITACDDHNHRIVTRCNHHEIYRVAPYPDPTRMNVATISNSCHFTSTIDQLCFILPSQSE
ncbi:hypothetical protein J6590_046971 [Homalodisca vitripennis]|nr:hypothetical protein J6590_046971 [Homalodisca vitripennis]